MLAWERDRGESSISRNTGEHERKLKGTEMTQWKRKDVKQWTKPRRGLLHPIQVGKATQTSHNSTY